LPILGPPQKQNSCLVDIPLYIYLPCFWDISLEAVLHYHIPIEIAKKKEDKLPIQGWLT
jgi:hypothetical protein